jgi:hypothetical protein
LATWFASLCQVKFAICLIHKQVRELGANPEPNPRKGE